MLKAFLSLLSEPTHVTRQMPKENSIQLSTLERDILIPANTNTNFILFSIKMIKGNILFHFIHSKREKET